VLIGACVKWVDQNPEVDPLHGSVQPRSHGHGLSDSDLAAVEIALRLGEEWDAPVVVACVGPAGADLALRELLACGVQRATRVQVEGVAPDARPSSSDVARLIAASWSAEGVRPDVVVCGDASADQGSGAVPAYLAHEMGAEQALGLIGVAPVAAGRLSALRRLDGGRRERLTVSAPAVVSVEGGVAVLRRAPLAAKLAARDAPVEVRLERAIDEGDGPRLRPWRPRPRALPGPPGDTALERIVALSGALVDRTPPRTLVLEPAEAADAILAQLREWGYLPPAG
jgi:electron transfer flavoprotein beta subunit